MRLAAGSTELGFVCTVPSLPASGHCLAPGTDVPFQSSGKDRDSSCSACPCAVPCPVLTHLQNPDSCASPSLTLLSPSFPFNFPSEAGSRLRYTVVENRLPANRPGVRPEPAPSLWAVGLRRKAEGMREWFLTSWVAARSFLKHLQLQSDGSPVPRTEK